MRGGVELPFAEGFTFGEKLCYICIVKIIFYVYMLDVEPPSISSYVHLRNPLVNILVPPLNMGFIQTPFREKLHYLYIVKIIFMYI